MKKAKMLAAATLAVALGGLSDPSLAAKLKCAGSTTVTNVVFTPDILKEINDKLGIELEVVGNSSGAGFKELLDGKAPCSMSTAAFEDLVKNTGVANASSLKVWQLGRDSAVPIVYRNNAVKAKPVTKEQWGGNLQRRDHELVGGGRPQSTRHRRHVRRRGFGDASGDSEGYHAWRALSRERAQGEHHEG